MINAGGKGGALDLSDYTRQSFECAGNSLTSLVDLQLLELNSQCGTAEFAFGRVKLSQHGITPFKGVSYRILSIVRTGDEVKQRFIALSIHILAISFYDIIRTHSQETLDIVFAVRYGRYGDGRGHGKNYVTLTSCLGICIKFNASNSESARISNCSESSYLISQILKLAKSLGPKFIRAVR
jgi:hypothetical protein